MKTLIIFLTFAFVDVSLAQQASKYPFYVALTQEYSYPTTKWSTKVGGIEQVVNETTTDYMIPAPNGSILKLPKKITKIVTPEEAAASLIQERVEINAMLARLSSGIKQLVPMVQAAKLAQQQNANAISLTKNSYNGSLTKHWIKENIGRGTMIVLDDGSLWEIDRMDKLDASLWLRMSNITIVSSSEGSPGFVYLLVNTDDKEQAHAKFTPRQ